MKITIVIPLCKRDFFLTCNLLEWLLTLKGNQERLDYDCIFVFYFFGFKELSYLGNVGRNIFRHCHFIIPSSPPKKEGWPDGPNYLFEETIKSMKEPFLWLEPDCVPLCPGWIDYLNEEYFTVKSPFMGTVNTNGSLTHLSGVAIYPADAKNWYKGKLPSEKAFDMVNQEDILQNTNNTQLIQNFWGQRDIPPTFREYHEKGEPENVMTLESISKSAVLFHRCKDGSLTKLLRSQLTQKVAT